MSRAWFLIVLIPALPCAAQNPRKEAVSSLVPVKGSSGATSKLTPATGPAAQPVRTGTSGISPVTPIREGTSGLVRPAAQSSLVKPTAPSAPSPLSVPSPAPPAILPPSAPVVEVVRPVETPRIPPAAPAPPPAIVAQPTTEPSSAVPAKIFTADEGAPAPKQAEVVPLVPSKSGSQPSSKSIPAPQKTVPAIVATPSDARPPVPVLITREDPGPLPIEKPSKTPAEVVRPEEPDQPSAGTVSSMREKTANTISAPSPQVATSPEAQPASSKSASLPAPEPPSKAASNSAEKPSQSHLRKPVGQKPARPAAAEIKPEIGLSNTSKRHAPSRGETEMSSSALPTVLHEAPVLQPPMAAAVDLRPTQPVAAHIAEPATQKSAADAARSPLFKPLPVQRPSEATPPPVPLRSEAPIKVAKLESLVPTTASTPEPPVIDRPKLEVPKLGEPKSEPPMLEEPKIDLPNLPEPAPVMEVSPPRSKPQRLPHPTPHAAHDDLKLPPEPLKAAIAPAPAIMASPLPPPPGLASSIPAQPVPAVESIAPPMPTPAITDTAQIAPSAPTVRKPLPYGANFGSDPDSAELAAEVAAILSSSPPPQAVRPARVTRPKVVSFPSEQWLREASAGIERLPENERPAAFQKIIERYKRMRDEEKSAPR